MSPSRISVADIVTTGSAGSASGSVQLFSYPSRLIAVEVDYAPGVPATTDLTITNGPRTVLTVANSSADKLVLPRVPVQDAAGGDLTGRLEEPPLVNGFLTVALAQTNPADPAATVRLFLAPA